MLNTYWLAGRLARVYCTEALRSSGASVSVRLPRMQSLWMSFPSCPGLQMVWVRVLRRWPGGILSFSHQWARDTWHRAESSTFISNTCCVKPFPTLCPMNCICAYVRHHGPRCKLLSVPSRFLPCPVMGFCLLLQWQSSLKVGMMSHLYSIPHSALCTVDRKCRDRFAKLLRTKSLLKHFGEASIILLLFKFFLQKVPYAPNAFKLYFCSWLAW